MRVSYSLLLVCLLWSLQVQATSCLQAPELAKLDQQYENALLANDTEFLAGLLADDFIWVHNLANAIESKAELLARLKARPEKFKSRGSSVLSLHSLDNTTVIHGTALVERVSEDGLTSRASRYYFMRTYVAQKGKCNLLSVQTMKVWSSGEDEEVTKPAVGNQ